LPFLFPHTPVAAVLGVNPSAGGGLIDGLVYGYGVLE